MNLNKGFTLIELLIVIGVLGILASGLMAAVDPFEQLKKARDANNRNAIIELHNATTRYYATHGSLPWDDTSTGSTTCVPSLFTTSTRGDKAANLLQASDCVTLLEGDGELKTGFNAALGSGQPAKMYVTSPSTTQVITCFSPEGKALFKDAQTKYNNKGTDCSGTGGCAGGPDCSVTGKASLSPGSSCYWCAR